MRWCALAMLVMLVSCGERPSEARDPNGPNFGPMEGLQEFSVEKERSPNSTKTFDMATPETVNSADAAANDESSADTSTDDSATDTNTSPTIPSAAPQIAYSYTYGYRLDADAIQTVQQAHIALCDKLAAIRCRIVSLERVRNDGEFGTASLIVQLDSRIARTFGAQLDKSATSAGGTVSEVGITAEDLSKQIVDTAARIKAKQALADRLIALLQNRAGKVGELVEAERAFAQAQEELDAARSWIAEMQTRVAMSKVEIKYYSVAPEGGGFWSPVRDGLASAGRDLGSSIASLVTFIVVIIPWILLIAALVWLTRRLGWRLRLPWRRKDMPQAPQ